MAIVNANALIPGAGGQTNYAPNPRSEGAVPGTPGTVPTGTGPSALSGLNQTVVGRGIDVVTGVPYFDVRFYGTSTAGFIVYYHNAAPYHLTPIAPGTNWTASAWCAVVAGSMTNVSANFNLQLRFNGGQAPATVNTTFAPTATLTLYQVTGPSTVSTTSIQADISFNCTIGQPIDITIRYALTQLEMGTARTPQIWPAPGAVGWSTRALLATPDVLGPPGIQYAECTIYGRGSVGFTPGAQLYAANATIAGSGGTTNYSPNPWSVGGFVGVGTGAFPTAHWDIGGQNGLQVQTMGYGVDADTGLPYVDIRWSGIATGTFIVHTFNNTPYHLLPWWAGSTHTFGVWIALVAGSLNGINSMGVQFRFNAGVPGTSPFVPITLTPTLSYYSQTATATTGTVNVNNSLNVNFTSGAAIDFTLRFGPQQHEIGPAPTPQVWPPPGTAAWATRALLAMPTVLPPVGIQYADAIIAGRGGFATTGSRQWFAASTIAGLGGQTNWIRNPRFEGMVPGTPGTMPTFWSAPGPIGLSYTLGTTTISGVPFVTMRFFGTTNAAGGININFDSSTNLPPMQPGGAGSPVTFSVTAALIAGTHPTNLVTIGGVGVTANNVALNASGWSSADISTQLSATPRRFTLTGTPTDPLTAYVRWTFQAARGSIIGQVEDFTLAFAYPQAETGSVATPIILPPPGTGGSGVYPTRGLLAMPDWPAGAAEFDAVGTLSATATVRAGAAATLSTETGMVWDPASRVDPVNTTLSDDNRTVTRFTNSGFDGVRGILPPLGAGKFYAEFTPPGAGTTWTSSCSIGVCSPNANYQELYNTATNGALFQTSYGIWVHNVDTLLLHGAWMNQETAAVAVDLDNERIWFRVLPDGLWNGTPGADPTIPSTGVDISPIPLVQQLELFAQVNLDNRSIRLNAGSVPFQAAVPAGFISWPPPGHVQASPSLVAPVAAGLSAVGNLQATARVLAAAGTVTIAGGEGNRLDQRVVPVTFNANTVVVSTDIPPPPGVYTPVYLHTLNTTADNAAGVSYLTNPTPFIPYRYGVWVYVPSSWVGAYIVFQPEGTGATNVPQMSAGPARGQWQYLSSETDAVASANGRLVCRALAISLPDTFYTAGWVAIPDTVVGGATSREFATTRITGTGGVSATATLIAGARSTLPGVGGHFNFVRNPLHLGAVPGTPGTLPTYWSNSLSGISQQVVGTGTDVATGLPYIDIRLFGTTNNTSSNIRVDSNINSIPATNGETWTQSFYAALVAGTNAGFSLSPSLYQTSANGTILGNTGSSGVILTGSLTRLTRTTTISTPGTVFNWPVITIFHTNSFALDITLRLAGQMLELGSVATGLVLPAPGTTGFSSFGLLIAEALSAPVAGQINGVGNLVATAQLGLVAATMAGTGNLAATATVRAQAGAVFAGDDSVTADARPARATSTALAGVGSVTASATVRAASAALVPGAGAFSATAQVRGTAAALVAGTGSFVADTTPGRPTGSVMPGVGSVSATAWVLLPAAARLAGLGSFSVAIPSLLAAASTTIAGGGLTNWIRNPRAEGLIPGTPGTIPTFWQAWPNNGLNRDLSLQVINGEPFTVARFYGNTNVAGGLTLFVEGQNALPMHPLANGQTVTFSVDLAIIAGSHPPPLYFTFGGVPVTSTFVAIGAGFQSPDITLQLTATPQRFSVTYTANDPTTAFVRYNILPIRGATLGQAIDVTVAIGYPQAETNPFATPIILPPPGAPQFWSRSVLAMPQAIVQAAAQINGTGALVGTPQLGLVAATIPAQAAVQAQAALWAAAGATLGGVGNLVADARPARPSGAVLAGLGGVSATAVVRESAAALLLGDDNLVAIPVVRETAAALFVGDDNVSAAAQVRVGVTALLAGTGTLGADAGPARAASATLTGVGAVAGSLALLAPNGAQLTGVGSLVADAPANQGSRAQLAGVGSLVATAVVLEAAASLITGTGSVAADARPARAAAALLPGIGTVVADATPRRIAAAFLPGAGAILAGARVAAVAAAEIDGLSDLDADAIRIAQGYQVSALLNGVGSFSASVTAGGGASARIPGVGSVLAPAVSRLLTQASVAATGGFTATATEALPALARFAAVGSVRADARPARAAQATIAGRGGQTNWIHNPRGEGATPGIYPSNVGNLQPTWWDTDVNTGLSKEIIGSFVVDGVDVLRVRAFGTPDPATDPTWAAIDTVFEYTPSYTPGIGYMVGLSQGQTYTRSFYLRFVAGSWTNILSATFWGISQDATKANNIPPDPRTPISPLPGSTLTRYSDTITSTGGVAPYQSIAFGLTIQRVDPPGPVDVTFDIGGGQVEFGAVATPLIVPPVGQLGASTRGLWAQPVTSAAAQATLGASGALIATANVLARAAARIDGEGLIDSEAYSPAQQVISGEGFFVAISAQVIAAAAARFDGVGGVRGGYAGLSFARARLAGQTDCWAEDYQNASQPVVRLRGVGQLIPAPVFRRIAGAAPTARSGFVGDAWPAVFVGVRLWPEGQLIATPNARLAAAARIGGVGGLSVGGVSSLAAARLAGVGQLWASATVARQLLVSARLAGAGHLDAAPYATTKIAAAARFAGTGQLLASASAPVRTTARLAAVGGLLADATVAETSGLHPTSARLAAVGQMVGSPTVVHRLFAEARLAGVGSLVADPVFAPRLVPAAGRIDGVGRFVETSANFLRIAGAAPTGISHIIVRDFWPAVFVGARLWPEGKLVGLGTVRASAGAHLAGSGTLQATAPVLTAARLQGTGQLAARAGANRILAATLGGTGQLTADAIVAPYVPVTRYASALIAGEGAFPADHPWDNLQLRGTTGLPPIFVLAAASARLSGTGQVLTELRHHSGAALLAGEGRFTDHRGGKIFDETDMRGRTSLRRPLAGVVRGAISLSGRLKPSRVLVGVVQGEEK